jgi:hypothetical protein
MQYAKFLAAVAATVISGLVAAMSDAVVSPTEWINVAIAGVGACAVFAAPNVPYSRYTKAVLAVLTAVLTFLVSAITDGVVPAEWLQIIVIALGAVGVYAVPNRPGETRAEA